MAVAPLLDAPPLKRHAPPELVEGASPAAGANFTQAVDSFWWRLVSLYVRLVNDANAANRELVLEYLTQGGNRFYVAGAPNLVSVASDTTDYCFNAYQGQADWPISSTVVVPLAPILLAPGMSFKILVNNIQATDQLSRIRYVVERFVVPSASDYDFG